MAGGSWLSVCDSRENHVGLATTQIWLLREMKETYARQHEKDSFLGSGQEGLRNLSPSVMQKDQGLP